MAAMIQLRNVPDDVHRKLKATAALAGMSLSAYALAELERGLERPTPVELLQRLKSRIPVSVQPDPADVIRQERDHR